MLNAFSYMFKDNKIFKKFLQLYAVLLVGILLIPMILFVLVPILAIITIPKFLSIALLTILGFTLGVLFNCALSGYIVSCIRAISVQEDNIVLPFFEIKKNIKSGFKLSVAIFLFVLPFILTVLICLGTSLFTGLNLLQTLASIFAIVLILVFLAIVLCTYTGFCWIFAHTENVESFFQFKKLKEIVGYNEKQYIVCVILNIIVNLLAALLSELCNAHWSLIILFFLTLPYIIYVYSYLVAKSINKSAIQDVRCLLPIKKLKF